MRAEFYQPPPGHPLRPYVLGIFRVRRDGGARETILPKGNVDLLINLGDPIAAAGESMGEHRLACGETHLAGLQTRSLVTVPAGRVDLLGVNLRAEGCAALLPLPLAEVTDRVVDGEQVFRELRALGQRAGETEAFDAQCALLVRWLLSRLRHDASADVVRHGCALLRRGDVETVEVRGAAKALAVSPRHLRRLFDRHVGVSPRQYARLARFVDALHLLSAPGRTLTEVAHAARYYDQAHFCHDFRTFAGMTPQDYRAAGAAVPGHVFSA
jgi:AraC-like DNA-binding protein